MSEHRKIIYEAKCLMGRIERIQEATSSYTQKSNFECLVSDFPTLFPGYIKYQKLSSDLYSNRENMDEYCRIALEGLKDIQQVEASILIIPMIDDLLGKINCELFLMDYQESIDAYHRVLNETGDKYVSSVQLTYIEDHEKNSINPLVINVMRNSLLELKQTMNTTYTSLHDKWV